MQQLTLIHREREHHMKRHLSSRFAALIVLSFPLLFRAAAAPLAGLSPESYGILKKIPVYIQEWHIWWGFPWPDRRQPFSHIESPLTVEKEPWRLFWNRNGYPLVGLYDSGNPEIIRWQIRCMKAAGLTTAAAMIHPEWNVGESYIQEESRNLIKLLLDIAAEEQFPIFFMDEVAFRKGSPAQHPEVMIRRFVRFLKQYGSHPGLWKQEGHPVIYFQTYGFDIPSEELGRVFDAVEAETGPVSWMTFGDPGRFGSLKKLRYFVSGSSLHRKNAQTRQWQLQNQDPEQIFAAARKQGKTISDMQYIRFDGTSQNWRQTGVTAYGLDGRRLEKTILASLRGKPDFVMLSSWNDWEEGTTMEPGWDFDGFSGDPYRYCRVVAHLKGREFIPPPLPPKESVHPTIWEKLGYGDGAGPLVDSVERTHSRGGSLIVTVRDTVSEITGLEAVWEGDLFWKAPQSSEAAATGYLQLTSRMPIQTERLCNVFEFTQGRAMPAGGEPLRFDSPQLRTFHDHFAVGVATEFQPEQPFGRVTVTMPNRETVRRMEPRGAVETTSTLNFTPHTRKEQFPADLWDGWRTAVGLNPRPIDFSRGGLTLTAPGQKVGQISLLGAPRPDRVLHNGRNVEGSDGRHKRFIVAIPDEILDTPGAHFLWLRACDKAGNWGSPILYAVPNYESFDRSETLPPPAPLSVPGAVLAANAASLQGWNGTMKIVQEKPFGRVFRIGNGTASRNLSHPVDSAFTLSFDAIHRNHRRLLLVGLLDDAMQNGLLVSWDSSGMEMEKGNGVAGIRLYRENTPVTWSRTGTVLQQGNSGHHAVSTKSMAKFTLHCDPASRRATLRVDGKTVAETSLPSLPAPLTKLYIRGNDAQLLNNIVVSPGK